MPKHSAIQYRLQKIKKQARKLAKELTVTQTEALDIIARKLGYELWRECRQAILDGAKFDSIPDPKRKDPSDKPNSIRHSILSFGWEDFENPNSFRNHVERELKDIIANSKAKAAIFVDLYIDEEIYPQLEQPENYFTAIKNRFPQIEGMRVFDGPGPSSSEDITNLYSQSRGA